MEHRSELLDANVGLGNVTRPSRRLAPDLNSRQKDQTSCFTSIKNTI